MVFCCTSCVSDSVIVLRGFYTQQVLITRLGDLQLAIVVSRLYEPDNALPDSLRKVLRDEILG